ncbi:hypothetical protein [Staphylococcus equorum]|uniref:hypothetical protein n=1 Tax=Staphylococcus equorum TaxID=246432 RepID=UPI0023AFB4FC|nr:hypothetical protein [Staphylococcus equorum]
MISIVRSQLKFLLAIFVFVTKEPNNIPNKPINICVIKPMEIKFNVTSLLKTWINNGYDSESSINKQLTRKRYKTLSFK